MFQMCAHSRLALAVVWLLMSCLPMAWANASPDQQPAGAAIAYHESPADGTPQPFLIQFPQDYAPAKSYPLLVYLAQNVPKPEAVGSSGQPYFKIHVGVHGVLAFPGLADADMRAAIATMKRDYPIDERRVFLSGFSAGGSAVMTIASRYPDLFAGAIPLGAFGNNAFLDSLYNLPVFCHHGQQDWVSAIDNVRVYHQQLRAMGAPALLKEYPTRGHSVGNPENMNGWLLAQRRVDRPLRVVHRCDTPEHGKAYWLHIRQFSDIHQTARVSALQHGVNEQQTLIVATENIDVLQIDVNRSPVEPKHRLIIQADGDLIELASPLPDNCTLVRGAAGWTISKEWSPASDVQRAYRPGGAANLYLGEPLLIVWGTQSDDGERTAELKRMANELATCGGPYCLNMKGKFPVKADMAVTKEDLARFNLLLIGTSADNAVTKRMEGQLLISVSATNELQAGQRETLSLSDSVLGFGHFNPLQPERFVYLLAPYVETAQLKQLRGQCARLLLGADGLRKGDQPDLVVQTVERVQRRHMQFDQHWQWRQLAGSDRLLPPQCGTRDGIAAAHLRAMRRRAEADFGLWWGIRDKLFYGHDFNIVEAYDTGVYSLADYRCKTAPMTSMTGSISGAELREIYERWISKRELLTVPEVDPAALDPDRLYRIVLPHELVVKLGSRKKLLLNVAPGPAVTTEETLGQVFRE